MRKTTTGAVTLYFESRLFTEDNLANGVVGNLSYEASEDGYNDEQQALTPVCTPAGRYVQVAFDIAPVSGGFHFLRLSDAVTGDKILTERLLINA